ncbi:nitrate/nitrite transporter NrtS [Vibrio sonorensis]|uniref:nitrate/nitrite transporter NrtS n=1 Tax=Vibrio sonorensis TaxID=1004316 RepID=UPI000A067A91|nr:nitrate/nitrite transporter NrtS [Vibrio sonorensis]
MDSGNSYIRSFISNLSISIAKRSLKVALVVGTILMFINHGDAILAAELDATRISKILLTYMVPFCVSTFAGVTAKMESNC